MQKLKDTRQKIRNELEVPAALRYFGSGWWSGALGIILALAALGGILCVWFPGVFSIRELEKLHLTGWYRPSLWVIIALAFVFSLLSLLLRPTKTLGMTAMFLSLLGLTICGNGLAPLATGPTPYYFGLDFFLLRLLLTGLVFIPVENLFPSRPGQGIFRYEWREDLFYFFISSMLVQLLTWLSLLPANTLLAVTQWSAFRAWVAALPFVVQLVTIMLLTDFVQYWVHRTFHRVPVLWRFHSVHHSAQCMDWMAGARMHFLEILILRGTTVIPMIVLGFSPGAVNTYLLVVYLYATFVHANLGFRFGFLEKFLVTPRFHHWHHGIEKEAIDVNFAVHFPWYDKIFGTHHMPENNRWPEGYGIGGHPVPSGYWKQFLHPFRRKRKH
jgi:sterol desaturase/sphingolipid hydroxylase (fatty acid hydroxylase superfamily)